MYVFRDISENGQQEVCEALRKKKLLKCFWDFDMEFLERCVCPVVSFRFDLYFRTEHGSVKWWRYLYHQRDDMRCFLFFVCGGGGGDDVDVAVIKRFFLRNSHTETRVMKRSFYAWMGSTYRLCGREEEEKYKVQREYIACIIGILVFMQIVRLFAAHCTLMWLV